MSWGRAVTLGSATSRRLGAGLGPPPGRAGASPDGPGATIT